MWVILLPEKQRITYQNANNEEHVIYHAIELEMSDNRFGYYNTGKTLNDPTEKPTARKFEYMQPKTKLYRTEKVTRYSQYYKKYMEETVPIQVKDGDRYRYIEDATGKFFPDYSHDVAWTHYEPVFTSRAAPDRSIYHIHDTHTGAFVAATTKRPSAKRDAKKPTLLDDLYAYDYIIQDDGMIVYTHPTGRVMKVKPSVLEQR